MKEQIAYSLIKLAAGSAVPVNYSEIEDYFTGPGLQRAFSRFNGSHNNDSLTTGQPLLDSYLQMMANRNITMGSGKDAPVLLPADDKGNRAVVSKDKLSEEDYAKAYKNYGELTPDNLRKGFADYKKALEENRKGEILGGAALAGGVGAISSYVGLGMLSPLKRHKLIRAMLALTAGAGVGYAYHAMSDKDIYRNYDWDKIREQLNNDPEALKAILKGRGTSIDKIVPASTSSDSDKSVKKQVSKFIDRYGKDVGVGTAAGVGAYLLAGAVPKVKNNKLLRALIGLGVGTGAGALTDVLSNKG